ncbi:MAG: hypothetical protein WC732_06070 [Candidatus Omnitrophota bacterium]
MKNDLGAQVLGVARNWQPKQVNKKEKSPLSVHKPGALQYLTPGKA